MYADRKRQIEIRHLKFEKLKKYIATNRTYYANNKLLKSSILPKRTKIIKPIL